MNFYNEIDFYAARWLRNLISAGHVAPGVVDERSIVEIDPAELGAFTQCHFFAGIGVWSYALRLAGWPDDRPVWTGSCPCQPFSAAGKGEGHQDERHLWPAWFRLIRECRPSIVFGEQVASADGLAWLDAVCTDVETEGYAIGAADLCAAGLGAPHIRQRLFFVADTGCVGLRQRHEHGKDVGPSSQVSGEVRQQRIRFDDSADGTVCGLGDAIVPRLERHAGNGDDSQGRPQQDRPASASGFWSAAEWLPCSDGKSRPVKSGTRPLLDGAAFRMGSGSAYEGKSRAGMLKAYGNAIVPQVAAVLIQAYMSRHEELPA